MQGLIRCAVCEKYISCTKDGRAMHMKRYHGVTVHATMKRYTPEEKALLVSLGEQKIGLEYFITPTPLDTTPKPIVFESLIPAKYCDPEGANICMWVKHGFDACGPCETRKEWEAKQTAVDDDIKYQD